MKRLQGRNLKHPGCLIGITAGLTIGIALAGGLAYTTIPYRTLLLIWLGITVVCGGIGWIIGDRMSQTTVSGNSEEVVSAGEVSEGVVQEQKAPDQPKAE